MNLPASLVIDWMWAHNDSVMYAVDDHQLIVYVPWLLLAYGLWYFIAYRIEQFTNALQMQENKMGHVVTGALQVFSTFEVAFPALVTTSAAFRTSHATELVCQLVSSWAWVLMAILGWAGTFAKAKRPLATNASL